MKVGINLINFGPGASPESFERWARFAETSGYHFVAVSDHVAVTPDVAEQYPAPFYDPLTVLSWLAGSTERVGLATTVIVLPYRHPLQLARVTANLDRLSGGRFILGVGVGWAKEEYRALGVPFEKRGAIADDYLEAVVSLWTKESASHEGPFVSFRDVQSEPLPVQRPHPPIWVGGGSRAALRRAVRFGGAWHPINPRPGWLEAKGVPRLRSAAEEAERPVPALAPRIRFTLGASKPGDERLLGEGDLDQLRGDFERLAALGASHVLLDTFTGDLEATRHDEPFLEALSTLAERVLDLPNEGLR